MATIISAAKRDLYCENNTCETLRYRCIAYDMKSLEEINKVILRTPFDSSEACKGHDHTLKSKSKQPTEHFFFFFVSTFHFNSQNETKPHSEKPNPSPECVIIVLYIHRGTKVRSSILPLLTFRVFDLATLMLFICHTCTGEKVL